MLHDLLVRNTVVHDEGRTMPSGVVTTRTLQRIRQFVSKLLVEVFYNTVLENFDGQAEVQVITEGTGMQFG